MGVLSWLFGQKSNRNLAVKLGEKERSGHPETSNKLTAQVQWRLGSFPMSVVGESYYQGALIAICGPHTRRGHDGEYPASIELEPANRHDPNAVLVKIDQRTVGHLPREQAERVSAQMVCDGVVVANCNARVRGGWRTNQHEVGHYGVWLAIPNWGWIDFGIGASDPTKHSSLGLSKATTRPEASRTGPLVGEWIALIGAPSDGDIAKELANHGAKIMANVGKSTTMLVVVDERPFSPGLLGSSRYRQAQEMSNKGRYLRIVSISEARELMGTN